MAKNLTSQVQQRIKNITDPSRYNVTLLPDFFVDHLLHLHNIDNTLSDIKRIYSQGGGNLPGAPQHLHQGGNAANTAYALAQLGVKSHLICRTSPLGLYLLRYFMNEADIDLSGVKTNGELAITTALEFDVSHNNVMIGDTGSVSNFSFDHLASDDLNTIKSSDIVGVVNWSLNHNGTKLATKVFQFAKKHQVKTFFDPGDPAHRKDEIPELKNKILSSNNLDMLGINENELRHFNSAQTSHHDDVLECIHSLQQHVSAQIDVHTTTFAYTSQPDNPIQRIPTFILPEQHRATGAGDIWNAGNLFAELHEFTPEERLLFANAAAGCYLSSKTPTPPTLTEITRFLKNTNLR